MVSIYQLKPRFQTWLRPLVTRCAEVGVTANGVTLAALAISLVLGAVLLVAGGQRTLFLLLPMWMFLRMAFNAVDGMLAREFGQQSALGAYLNELFDVVSDAALYLPFVLVAPFGWASVGVVIFLPQFRKWPVRSARWSVPSGATTARWARATGLCFRRTRPVGWAEPHAARMVVLADAGHGGRHRSQCV